MWKMLKWVILLAVIAYLASSYYLYHRAGLGSMPELPEGAFWQSYGNELRAIIVGLPNEKQTRQYLGYAYEVPSYFSEAWSYCKAPTKDELAGFEATADENFLGQRLDAICTIDVDGRSLKRGFITSIPRL